MERVEVIERKLDSFESNTNARFDAVDRRFDAVDRRFEAVDRRFDQVDEAFVEQRRYTEFANEQLTARMDSGFAEVHHELQDVRDGLDEVRGGLIQLRGDVGRIERKLDWLIDQQPPKSPGPQ